MREGWGTRAFVADEGDAKATALRDGGLLLWWAICFLDVRLPAFFVGAIPLLHGFRIVLDVAVGRIEVEDAVGEVSDVGELQRGYADVAGCDGLVELLAVLDGGDEVGEVEVGHVIGAGQVG